MTTEESFELTIKNEKDMDLVQAFVTHFPNNEMIKGVLMDEPRFIGLTNSDRELETAKRVSLVPPSLVSEALLVLKLANVEGVRFLQRDDLPLQIFPEGCNLQILVSLLTEEPSE